MSGIVLTFEFGLNWGRFAHDVGPIVGVIIAVEVVTAFFLEAGFLGLLVYGEGRIGKRMMLFSTCMVSLGTLLSVTWILVANSWMQTPDGFKEVHGQFQPVREGDNRDPGLVRLHSHPTGSDRVTWLVSVGRGPVARRG